ncbi:MAG: hypothetical protein QOI71_3665 [Gaiellales bacterium]|jgi:hypothetical protein|nr:hypothetical protein [Gaiellales bacterium]MDX6621679.1 hypothetical protein [Gaiellales bacterium]
MRPAGPVAALAASALALGAASPDRLSEAHVALASVSAQPNPRLGGVPQVLRRDRATRWRVRYTVRGKTRRALASYARITLQYRSTRWRFRSATVTQVGATTWQYVAPVPRWFPAGSATLMVEVHLTVRGQVAELSSRTYHVRVR